MNSNQSGEANVELANSIYTYCFRSGATPDQSEATVLLSKWRQLKIGRLSPYSYRYSGKSRLLRYDLLT